MRCSVCIEPEKSSALIVQCYVDQDAYAGIILKGHGLYALHVVIFCEFLLIRIGIRIALALVIRCNDNNVDVFLLGKLLCCIFDIVDLFAREEVSIIYDFDSLFRRQVHEDIENNACKDNADKRDSYTDRSAVKLRKD